MFTEYLICTLTDFHSSDVSTRINMFRHDDEANFSCSCERYRKGVTKIDG